jgi:CRP/FNR family transcriptional regulator, cyclic AMP receptor protein
MTPGEADGDLRSHRVGGSIAIHNRKDGPSMPLVPDAITFEQRLADLPVTQYSAGEDVLTAGSSTGRLLVLKSGAVEVVKDGVQIAKVSTPGAVFGELSVLLDQPHSADVRALEQSEFHIADAPTTLANDSTMTLYVAAILARRLDSANQALIEVKRQLQAGDPRSSIGRTVEKVEQLLSSVSVSLVYAGYPYDPFVPR